MAHLAAAAAVVTIGAGVAAIGHSVATLLPTHRQCSITIINRSSNALINPRKYIQSGQCARELPHEIGSSQEGIVEFTKTAHTARGAVGVLTYDIRGSSKKLAFMFSVPYDYNLYSNWHAAGFFGMGKSCDYNLYSQMYNNGENGFVKRKGGSAITHRDGGFTVRTTMTDTYTPAMTVEILGFRTIMELITTAAAYNASGEHDPAEQSLKIISIIVFSLAFILGVLGNGAVIWVTGFKMRKTINTIWYLNLAVADFLFTAFLPLTITYMAMDRHWPFGKFMCKLNYTVLYLNMFASVYILMVISVDRCVCVVCPVWAQNWRSMRKASCMVLGVWVLALVLSSPDLIFRDTETYSHNNENITDCYNNFAFSDDMKTPAVVQLRKFRHRAVVISGFLLGFAVPFTIIISCYGVIIHRLRRNRSLASHSSRPFKIIAAVITTFFLCWAPYHIMELIELVNYMATERDETLDHVTTIGIPITAGLAFINSSLNPLLYLFMGRNSKREVCKSILKVLEVTFEEVSRSNTNSEITSRSKDNSVSDTRV